MRRGGKRRKALRLRGPAASFATLAMVCFAVYSGWFVRHSDKWVAERKRTWPQGIFNAVVSTGEPVRDLADALGITGTDATCAYDGTIPTGAVLFAGAPVRTGGKAPDDIEIHERGEFTIGWSPKLRHPAWVAYHVPREIKYPDLASKRPGKFSRDPEVPLSPAPSHYTRSGYDRGHMAPNYAIASRFGAQMQTNTFFMSNIAPQTKWLNRGVWRDIEHRIAGGWAERWGEVWIVVGSVPGGGKTIPQTDIDVPAAYWQVLAAVSDGQLRALAVLVPQIVPMRAWPTRYIVSIRELEEITGYDFFPGLDRSKQDAIETKTPTRLWPVGFIEAFRNIWFRGI